MRFRGRRIELLTLALCMMPIGAAAAGEPSPLERGVEAMRKGQHAQAAELILQRLQCTRQEQMSEVLFMSEASDALRYLERGNRGVEGEALLDVLAALPCMVMISSYESALYEERLRGWRRVSFSANTQRGLRQECVWMNFSEPTQLHDASFLGATFRERQAVKRRHQRLFERFGRMAPVEREHVLQVLNTRYNERACTS